MSVRPAPATSRLAVVAALVAVACALAPATRAQDVEDEILDYVKVRVTSDRASYRAGETARITVEFRVDPKFHVNSSTPTADYQFPTSLAWSDDAGLTLSDVTWPAAEMRAFEFTEGAKIAVYEGTVRATLTAKIPADAKPGDRKLVGAFRAQGCTHTECYAPQTDEIGLVIRVGEGGAAATTALPLDGDAEGGAPSSGATIPATEPETAGAIEASTQPSAGTDAVEDDNTIDAVPPTGAVPPPALETLDARCPADDAGGLSRDRPLAGVFWLTFLGGILLAFTPCVLPLVPITIGFFSRQQAGGRRPVLPALLYVLGLALVYSALGTVAALSGGLFGAMLQKPVVVIAIAGILFALALSMFGVLPDVSLPSGITNRIGGARAGNAGAMMMGGAMGLVAAPCVGPLVVSLLTYVAEMGSRLPKFEAGLLGGGLFFALACGMGLPFFFVALGVGSLRTGEWMVSVKKFFGFVILGAVLYFLRPLIHPLVFEWGVVAVMIAGGAFFLVNSRSRAHGPRTRVALTAIGAMGIVATLLWTGFVLKGMGAGGVAAHAFAAYSDEALERAKADRRPVVVDFSAEWCIACRELEHRTFPDGRVQDRLKGFVSLRADLTEDNAVTKAIYKRWRIRGLPTIIFLDSQGNEIQPLRLSGYESPEAFADRLDCVVRIDVASR